MTILIEMIQKVAVPNFPFSYLGAKLSVCLRGAKLSGAGMICPCVPQGGRTWQAFGGGKHGHETFRHVRNYNFCDKCVVFARNLKFSNLTQ